MFGTTAHILAAISALYKAASTLKAPLKWWDSHVVIVYRDTCGVLILSCRLQDGDASQMELASARCDAYASPLRIRGSS